MLKRFPRSLLTSGLLAGLIAGAAPALAEGLYLGGALGKPRWDGSSVNGVSGDSSGSGFKLYGGYRFNPHLAVEGGAVNLGGVSGPAGDAKTRGGFVDLVGQLPLSQDWSALGRVGVANLKTTAAGASDRATGPKVGLGVQYQLTQNTALRGEWERYRVKGFDTKRDADLYSLGLNVSF